MHERIELTLIKKNQDDYGNVTLVTLFFSRVYYNQFMN